MWAAARTAIIADVHLGKADCLAVHGAPIPAGVIESQLAAIDKLLDTHSIERLLVVGDLLHAGIGLTPLVLDTVAAWRRRRPLPLLVVPGNHDRALSRVAQAWGLTTCPECHTEGPFDFVHDPATAAAGRQTFAGHIHPAIVLRGGGDSLRLPCFHLKPGLCVLPAFSAFTSGASIRPDVGDRVLAIAHNEVIEI